MEKWNREGKTAFGACYPAAPQWANVAWRLRQRNAAGPWTSGHLHSEGVRVEESG